MSQEDLNQEATYEANFEFIDNNTIQAVFEINPNISDLCYTHYQDVPQETWSITHNMGKYPSVTIATSAGEIVRADVQYINTNSLEVYFCGAFAGVAYLN